MLAHIDGDLRRQPKVSGSADQVLGRHLEAMITAAEALKALWKDDFVSVEHLVLAATDDPHYGADLCRAFQVTKGDVEQAVKDIRGSKRVSGAPHGSLGVQVHRAQPQTAVTARGARADQDPEGKYEALEKYAVDLTESARNGKLDPVIGRDDEIRRCIQILSRRTKARPCILC